MTCRASRVLMLMWGTLALLTACGPEAKQPALVSPQTDQTEPAKPTTPPGPTAATPAHAPAPAPSPAASRPPAPPPPAVTSPGPATPPAPAPATQQAQPPRLPADAPQAVIVSVSRANLREKPDTKARIIRVLTKGTKVVVLSKGNQWFRVRLSDGTDGWLAESVVTPAPAD